MKNLLIYTGPQKKFNEEDLILAKIQIDNSLELGWKKDDILLVTNFDFNYKGVRSFVIKDDIYYPFDLPASKLPVIIYLLKNDLISDDELYWCHDFDAYENYPISESELGLEGFDLGLTHYFYKDQWQFGSLFFRKSSQDILELLDKTILQKPHSSRNNEKTLTRLIRDNKVDNDRYKKLNVSYNLTKRYLQITYNEALKPVRVLHFRPSDFDSLMPDNALNMFMYGKNCLNIPLMTDRLIKIFHQHGIK